MSSKNPIVSFICPSLALKSPRILLTSVCAAFTAPWACPITAVGASIFLLFARLFCADESLSCAAES